MPELYVVFQVAGAEYALPASLVLQLESYQGATPVPGAADHVAGIIQVRGHVIPIIDLRRLFARSEPVDGEDTRVIVTEQAERRVGLLVDKSREVMRLDAATVQSTPQLVAENSRGFFAGVVQLGPRLIMLLDLHKVVGEEQLNDESPRRLGTGGGQQRALASGAAEFARKDGGADPGH